MGLVDNKEFLTQVSNLLTESNGKSSVYLTQKRLALNVDSQEEISKLAAESSIPVIKEVAKDEKNYSVLIRISNGGSKDKKKVKYSTVITHDTIDKFWVDYVNVLKNGMTGLKKKSKKNKKKVTK